MALVWPSGPVSTWWPSGPALLSTSPGRAETPPRAPAVLIPECEHGTCVQACGGAKHPFLMSHTALSSERYPRALMGPSITRHSTLLWHSSAAGLCPCGTSAGTSQGDDAEPRRSAMLEQWWSVGCIPEPRSPSEMEGADPNRGASPQRRASVPESTGPQLQTGRSFQSSSLRLP